MTTLCCRCLSVHPSITNRCCSENDWTDRSFGLSSTFSINVSARSTIRNATRLAVGRVRLDAVFASRNGLGRVCYGFYHDVLATLISHRGMRSVVSVSTRFLCQGTQSVMSAMAFITTYWRHFSRISVCFTRSSAFSIGVSMRPTIRNATRSAVFGLGRVCLCMCVCVCLCMCVCVCVWPRNT